MSSTCRSSENHADCRHFENSCSSIVKINAYIIYLLINAYINILVSHYVHKHVCSLLRTKQKHIFKSTIAYMTNFSIIAYINNKNICKFLNTERYSRLKRHGNFKLKKWAHFPSRCKISINC